MLMQYGYEAMRKQFEPRLLTLNGFCTDPVECAHQWDVHERHWPQAAGYIERAVEWLSRCPRRKSVNTRASGHSYGLKHAAERWHKNSGREGNCYVSNGALLMAAYLLGFEVRRDSYDRRDPNGWLNISTRLPVPLGAVKVRVLTTGGYRTEWRTRAERRLGVT